MGSAFRASAGLLDAGWGSNCSTGESWLLIWHLMVWLMRCGFDLFAETVWERGAAIRCNGEDEQSSRMAPQLCSAAVPDEHLRSCGCKRNCPVESFMGCYAFRFCREVMPPSRSCCCEGEQCWVLALDCGVEAVSYFCCYGARQDIRVDEFSLPQLALDAWMLIWLDEKWCFWRMGSCREWNMESVMILAVPCILLLWDRLAVDVKLNSGDSFAGSGNPISLDGHHAGAKPQCLLVNQKDTNAIIEMLDDTTPKNPDPDDGRGDRGSPSLVSPSANHNAHCVVIRHEVGHPLCSSVDFDSLSIKQSSIGHLTQPSLPADVDRLNAVLTPECYSNDEIPSKIGSVLDSLVELSCNAHVSAAGNKPVDLDSTPKSINRLTRKYSLADPVLVEPTSVCLRGSLDGDQQDVSGSLWEESAPSRFR
ncbi:hypothetical protein Nepgr_006652 [Nepenthes gracilis]|uniref:Uncharacterized protein n=1 Tax=Nepenthes gracilis TaxID=150966 RepID=A0AAD3XHI7_NEPGR|nr:hypothetical protein Nepgr_006652 [Nepenthes gracilis]